MEQCEKFLKYVGKHYEENKKRWAKYFYEKNLTFDEDVYSDTIVKIYDYLKKHKLQDESDAGFANYWFRAFKTNTIRETQYSRNQYRDKNIDASEELNKSDNGDDELGNKIKKECFNDWFTYNTLLLVEKNFDFTSFSCFRLYFILPKMTYKKLREITKINDCKRRVVTIKKWLQTTLNKDKILKEFNKYYYEHD